MTKIVLIDENVSLVNNLAKVLKEQRPDWTIHPVGSAAEGLALIESESIDVIVSDSRLPDMDGAEFFDKVRGSHPGVIRFTLSDDEEAEMLLECAHLNQRFISKPAEPQVFISAVDDSVRLRKLLAGDQLNVIMQDVGSLPAIPELYNQLVTELASPYSSLVKVSEIIECDAGLILSILKIVNSAYFGLNRRIESIPQAISFLGTDLIKNITLTSKVFSKFEGDNIDLKKLTQINNDALKMGALTNQFSRYAKISRASLNHSQIAGMMSNIGELIALTKSKEAFVNSVPSHMLGAYLMKVWMMPDAVTEAVAIQHDPMSANTQKVTPLVVLHSIRYLQSNFTDTASVTQRIECFDYMSQFITAELAKTWLDAYQALDQLVIKE